MPTGHTAPTPSPSLALLVIRFRYVSLPFKKPLDVC